VVVELHLDSPSVALVGEGTEIDGFDSSFVVIVKEEKGLCVFDSAFLGEGNRGNFGP